MGEHYVNELVGSPPTLIDTLESEGHRVRLRACASWCCLVLWPLRSGAGQGNVGRRGAVSHE